MGSVIQDCWHGRRIGTMQKAPLHHAGGRGSMKTTTDLKSIFQNAKSNKHGANHITKTTTIN
ncbi:hypothetical protein ACSZM8_09315 [Aeromonas caviae]